MDVLGVVMVRAVVVGAGGHTGEAKDDAGRVAGGAVVVAIALFRGAGIDADPVGEKIELLAGPVGVEVRAAVDHLLDPVAGGVRPGDLQGDDGVEGAVAAGGEEVRRDLMARVVRLVTGLIVGAAVLVGRVEVDEQIGREGWA